MPKRSVLGILAAGVCVVTAGAASGVAPQPVSPAGLVELRCPMFSWSAVSGAAGYELLVYEVLAGGDVGKEPLLSVRLPGGTAAWSPPGASCLAAGGRYIWTLRVVGKEGEGDWAESVLFEVAVVPSLGEVEAALATLRRYLEAADAEGGRSPAAEAGTAETAEGESARAAEAVAERLREVAASRAEGDGLRSVTVAAVPSLGTPSLTVDANVALGAASNFFKNGSVFLWDDTAGNTALGRLALASATGEAKGNTAFGREALHDTVPDHTSYRASFNTAVGHHALRSNTHGRQNTAIGSAALFKNTTGDRNTASGYKALYSNTSGHVNTATGRYALYKNSTGNFNTASGDRALFSNTIGASNTASGEQALYNNITGSRNTASGSRALFSNSSGSSNTASGREALAQNATGNANTAIGYRALYANHLGHRNTAVGWFAGRYATGSDNIFLGAGSQGLPADTNTIRIGSSTGVASDQQNRTFIAGINGITPEGAEPVDVVISSAGQLGTVNSSREVKQDLREVGELSRRLQDLRPVAFRYKVHAAGDPDTPLQFGLIAEEVAEVFPELVVRDGDGRPQTVKYHLLTALLLNELQRAEWDLERQRAELLAVRDRLTAVEEGRPPDRSSAPWWRRLGGGGQDGP